MIHIISGSCRTARGPLTRISHAAIAVRPMASLNTVPVTEESTLLPSTGQANWKSTKPSRLGRESIMDLLDGRTPAIVEQDFLSPAQCKAIEKEMSPKLSPYSHFTGPLLEKVGVAQFEYQAQSQQDFVNRRSDNKERYFAAANSVRNLHDNVQQKTGINAWAKVIGQVRQLVPEWDVVVASEGPDKKYFSGIYRAISNSTPIHCDWSPYDSKTEDWIINKVTKQIVFNLYCTPVLGGQTHVYEKQWDYETLKHRDPESYGYMPECVEGVRRCTIQPSAGQLAFFNSRCLHEVRPVGHEHHPVHGWWQRPRLTLSSFMGFLPPSGSERPKLILWS